MLKNPQARLFIKTTVFACMTIASVASFAAVHGQLDCGICICTIIAPFLLLTATTVAGAVFLICGVKPLSLPGATSKGTAPVFKAMAPLTLFVCQLSLACGILAHIKNNPPATVKPVKTAVKYDGDYSYLRRAVDLADHGRFAEAVAIYTHRLRSFPSDECALNNRVLDYDEMGRYAEALADINALEHLDPNAPGLNCLRALTDIGLGNIDEAEKLVLPETKTRGAHGFADNVYALVLYKQHRFEQSLKVEQDVIRNNSGALSVAYYRRGLCYKALHEPDLARADFKRVRETGVPYTLLPPDVTVDELLSAKPKQF